MNGLIQRGLAAACLVGTAAAGGCTHKYADVVDPCYPDRYNQVARAELIGAFAPQVHNGHILDQTLFNEHFESGTGNLNACGMAKLDYLVQRRPCPDPKIFLATARDLTYDAAKPNDYADNRRDLDVKRTAAVHAYLAAQTVGRPMPFDVVVHDPAPVGMRAEEMVLAIRSQRGGARGTIGAGLLSAGGSAANTGSTGAIAINNSSQTAGQGGGSGGGMGGTGYGGSGGGTGSEIGGFRQ
jgi:hypothetical protein